MKIKAILISICIIFTAAIASAQHYAPDLIITGSDAVWTDSRAYSDLSDAITAIGASEQTLLIAREETCTNLTVPDNVHLKFLSGGSITNSGNLDLNTTNIEAGRYQIFTGSGDIDFAEGSILNAAWGSTLENYETWINNENVTIIVDNPLTVASNVTLPENVDLVVKKGGVLTINNTYTLTLNGQFTAGPYKTFTLTGTGVVTFGKQQDMNIEWWGVSSNETAANNTTYANNAFDAAINVGTLLINGYYDVDDAIEIDVDNYLDKIDIKGKGWRSGFHQTNTAGADLITRPNSDIPDGWAEVNISDIWLTGNASAGDGIALYRCTGALNNIRIGIHGTTDSGFGGKAIGLYGCIEYFGSNIEIKESNEGLYLGTCVNGATTNSTNACHFAKVKVRTTDTGLKLEGDATNNLDIKGNIIASYDWGSSAANTIAIHCKGTVTQNQFLSPWLEGGDTLIWHEPDGSDQPGFNQYLNMRVPGAPDSKTIDLDDGDDNLFMGGFYSAGSLADAVDIEALASRNKFFYIRNFPLPGDSELEDDGNGTMFKSYGNGTNDATQDYTNQNILFPNGKGIQAYDSGGTRRSVLLSHASDRTLIYDLSGNEVFRAYSDTVLINPATAWFHSTCNVGLGTATDFDGGEGVLALDDAGTDPDQDGTSGSVVLWNDGGELKVVDSGGNTSTLSPHSKEYPDSIEVSSFPAVWKDMNKNKNVRRWIAKGKMAELVQELAWKEGLLEKDKHIIIYDEY